MFENMDTPYGKLLKDVDTGVVAKPGKTLLIKFVCPLALLWLLCNKSDRWCALVQRYAIVKPEMGWENPVLGPVVEPGALQATCTAQM